jgi:hypothetical protein
MADDDILQRLRTEPDWPKRIDQLAAQAATGGLLRQASDPC